MDYIIHRVNTISEMSMVNTKFGLEIDIVYENGQLLLKHSPQDLLNENTELEKYLKKYKHKRLILNIKSSGIEEEVISMTKKYTDDFLLLDVEFPFIIKNYKKFGKYFLLRISKYEAINNLEYFRNYIDWVWLDTYEEFMFKNEFKEKINLFNICLVSIERWNQDYEVDNFIREIKEKNLNIKAVMTDLNSVEKWIEKY